MSSIRLLIVEDNFFVAEEIQASIETLGFTVSARVDNGKDAIQEVMNNKPDLAIMDIHLKGDKDGIETARILTEEFNVPIIYLTDKSDKHTYERAKSTFPHDFLSKPINAISLKRSIELTLNMVQKSNLDLKSATIEKSLDNRKFIFKDRGVLHVIVPEEIMWIKAAGTYCEIKTIDKKFTSNLNMGKVLKILYKNEYFEKYLMRIGKSSSVNIHKIDRISINKVIIEEEEFAIGKNYREALLNNFQKFK